MNAYYTDIKLVTKYIIRRLSLAIKNVTDVMKHPVLVHLQLPYELIKIKDKKDNYVS